MKEASMFDRADALESCIIYLAAHWCPGGRIPADANERAQFVARIVDSYVTPLQPTPGWDEKLVEAWHQEKQQVGELMAIAAAKVANEQDTQLIN
jgi:hypothetical protein